MRVGRCDRESGGDGTDVGHLVADLKKCVAPQSRCVGLMHFLRNEPCFEVRRVFGFTFSAPRVRSCLPTISPQSTAESAGLNQNKVYVESCCMGS
jgi:hypothetical protein